MIKKSITKKELIGRKFPDNAKVELRYEITKDKQIRFLITMVPHKGKPTTLSWQINDLSEGQHPMFSIDDDEGKLGFLKKYEVDSIDFNFGFISAKLKKKK